MRVTSEHLLEFQELKSLVGRFLSSPLGAQELEKAVPGTDRRALEEALAETEEAIRHERALEQPQPAARGSAIRLRFTDVPDCREALARLRIEGTVLNGKEILVLTTLLAKAEELRGALAFSAPAYPRMAARASRLGDFGTLLRDLGGKILPDGSIADDASVALSRLRRVMERQRRRIEESLERFLHSHRDEGILQEQFVTIRNERFVVPIVAGRQRRIDGVIHGASGTGHTLFLEPLETIELNNELVRITEDALREEHRILREMTGRLRDHVASIEAAVRAVGELEFLFGKARFAVEFGAVIPRFTPDDRPRLMLRDARHPLLEDVLRRQRKQVVPLSLELAGDARTLLISGPNTGGKSVAIKTAGLFALMAQTGLPVPCAEAELPLFDEVLADIGDNQSIQESLSTFSAHVARIREMMAQVGPRSLVLLDELGRATDPEEGGALGVAVLDAFRSAGAFTLASTHLLALKVYGAETGGVRNASMGFDDKTLEPTYRLRVGEPGRSAGLDIAMRLGLPPSLIERARSLMSTRERDLADYLDRLRRQVERVQRREEELAERNRDLEERQAKLAAEWKRRETVRLEEMERHADAVIRDFETRAEDVIHRIGEEAAGRKAAAQARRQVARSRREFREALGEAVHGREQVTRSPAERLMEGATVRLKGIRQPATVRRRMGDDLVEVEAGYVKLQVPVEEIVEILPPQEPRRDLPAGVTVKAGPKAYLTTQEVNVIGRRAEEAVDEVDKFVDRAVMASVDRVRIIHGFGMGVLRKAIAELLTGHPHVERFYPATPAEGGAGATIAELKE